MDHYDPEKAARVWQRVRSGGSEDTASDLLSLIAEEWTDATAYLHLSRRFRGKESALLRRMHQEEQSHIACLKGIYTLLTGTHPVVRTPPYSQTSPDILLRRCYGREMQSVARYEAKSTDPEYGRVFSRLAQQEREHCRQVLELLGKLNGKP